MDICFDYLQVSDMLKRFAMKITTWSMKEHQKILLDLLPCILKKERLVRSSSGGRHRTRHLCKPAGS